MLKISILEYINNLQNWFITYEKLFTVYVSRPQIGYKVTNRITGDVQYTSNQNQFVVSRCNGEKWVISGKELTQQYKTVDGLLITYETIKKWLNGNEIFDWQMIVYNASSEIKWAIRIPLEFLNSPLVNHYEARVQYINKRGITHGNGDFLVAKNNAGFPNLFDIEVVNGEIFSLIYETSRFRGGQLKPKRVVKPNPIIHKIELEYINIKITKLKIEENLDQKNVGVIAPTEILISNTDEPEVQSKINDIVDWFKSQGCKVTTILDKIKVSIENVDKLSLFTIKLKQKYKCKFVLSDTVDIEADNLLYLGNKQKEIVEWLVESYTKQLKNKESNLRLMLNSSYELRVPAIVVLDSSDIENIYIINIINRLSTTINKQEYEDILHQNLIINPIKT